MGRWARQMNQILAEQLIEQVGRTMHWHPETTTTAGLAADGIHPSSEGYAVWADGLSRRILAAQAGCAGRAAWSGGMSASFRLGSRGAGHRGGTVGSSIATRPAPRGSIPRRPRARVGSRGGSFFTR